MYLKLLLSLGISLSFLGVFIYLVPADELLGHLRNIDTFSLMLAFSLYTVSQFLRSLRWKLLLKDLSLGEVFLINSANIFMNNVLPARTGELSWFYYARKLGISLKVSLWAFLVGRFYDLLSLVCLVALFYAVLKSPIVGSLWTALVCALALSLSLWKRVIPFSIVSVAGLFFLGVLSFLFKALSVYEITKGLGMFEFLLAFSGAELTSVLPVHGFMGLGTYETGFLLPLKALGYGVKESLVSGLVAHSFLLFSSALWGVFSITLLHTLSRKAP
ncbi:MAG TPA: UPF0104 family protein [Aquificaceae bacterium]|nr:UPF0104 family protein [Aquificaceae bacterium]